MQGLEAIEVEKFRAVVKFQSTAFRRALQHHQVLLLCARPDWASYPDTFSVDPWIAKHLQAHEAGSLCYIIDQWLDDQPLPPLVSEDPLVEDRKVKDLTRLFSALNR
jgi:hypothetical protein